MAEGGYDPTTENETPWEDHGIDHDGDDDDDDDTTPGTPGTPAAASTPYQPGATSTPYHPGEEHEITNLPQEQSGVQSLREVSWKMVKFTFPDANHYVLETSIEQKSQRVLIRMRGGGKRAYYLYTKSRETDKPHLNPSLPLEIHKALGKSTLEQSAVLQQERDTNLREIVQKSNKLTQMQDAAQEVKERQQDLENLRDRIKWFDDNIRELEDKAGPLDEETIQRLKDEKRALEAEHQRKREQLDQADADAKTALQLQVDINDLKLANRDIERQIN